MMSTIQSRLEKVATALTSISGLTVYHYYRMISSAPVCIWEETMESGSVETDGHKGEQEIEGYVHLFTKTEYDPFCDDIQNALNNAEDVYWMYNSVQYEEETNMIHHEWRFRVK